MGDRLTDSRLYRHLWGTEEMHALFGEEQRLQRWLEILAALAAAQAELGIIPAAAAKEIREAAQVERLDLEYVAEETRASSHSTLGLVRGLQRVLSPEAAGFVYYGATVQDLTDSWTATAMARVAEVAWRDLTRIERRLLELARAHRDTLMVGRTHGQPGAPITFGFKAASWVDELERHRERLRQGAPRWLVGQLAGAVGNLGFFAERGPALRAGFCARLGLGDPGISWTSSRDRVAEFTALLAMVTATLARIGNEVYQLQRPEIGELREASRAGTVGSITMPHKRNPEGSEQLVTLSRLVRASAALVLEGMVVEHERDGRAWKVEWPAFGEACLLTGAALRLGLELAKGLEVDAVAMARNLAQGEGGLVSERLLAELASRMGKHQAQALLQELFAEARAGGRPLRAGLEEAAWEQLPKARLEELLGAPGTGSCGAMVDEVVRRCGPALEQESPPWP